MFGWLKKKNSPKQEPSAQEVYAGLREQVLSLDPKEVGIAPTGELPQVWGVLMEFARPNAVVTLVSLADRTTSLYFSNGGGMIGAGENPSVAAATRSLIASAQAFHNQCQPTSEYPSPAVGKVKFYLLTFSGVVTAEADEDKLGNQQDVLWPLFHKGHEVISNIRIASEQ